MGKKPTKKREERLQSDLLYIHLSKELLAIGRTVFATLMPHLSS